MGTKAYGPCWSCRRSFWYGVATVPALPVDRADRPVDPATTRPWRTAPICGRCVDEVNVERVRNGLTPMPYDVVDQDAAAAEWRAGIDGISNEVDAVLAAADRDDARRSWLL